MVASADDGDTRSVHELEGGHRDALFVLAILMGRLGMQQLVITQGEWDAVAARHWRFLAYTENKELHVEIRYLDMQ